MCFQYTLAEITTGEAGFWAGFGVVLSTVIAAVVAGVVKLWTTRHEINRAEEENALKEYQKLVKVQETRIGRLEKKAEESDNAFDRLRVEHQECLIKYNTLMVRVEQYETTLAQMGVKVKPFGSSDTGEYDLPRPPQGQGGP